MEHVCWTEQKNLTLEGRNCDGRNNCYHESKKENASGEGWNCSAEQIVGMAFGTGGVNTSDVIVPHSPDQNALHSEVLRKEVDGYEVVSDTCIRYKCTLTESELANTYISEIGLYDADGDMVAMKAFMKKGKDSDMEVVFECEDTF